MRFGRVGLSKVGRVGQLMVGWATIGRVDYVKLGYGEAG